MSWYLEEGKDSDVVVSSRVRLARNIDGIKFVPKAEEEELSKGTHDSGKSDQK